MRSLPILAIALLLSGGALRWVSSVLYLPRIRRYLADHGIGLADSSYQVPELYDVGTARNFAKTRGQNPEFLSRYDWLNAGAFCLIASGIALVLACDVMGIRNGPAGSLAGSIPNWTIAYVLLFLAIEVRSLRPRGKRRQPAWLTGLEFTAALGRVTTFVSYWITEAFMGFQGTALLLYACSWTVFGSRFVWSLLHTRTEKRYIKWPEHQKRLLMWGTFILMVALNLPLFWYGLKAAVRGLAVTELGH